MFEHTFAITSVEHSTPALANTNSNTRSINRSPYNSYIKSLTIIHEHVNFALPLTRAKRAYYFPLTRIEETMPKKKSLNVYHLSATENTLRKMPKFNPYQTGHGVIGDTKYNRRKTKRELRKLIDES